MSLCSPGLELHSTSASASTNCWGYRCMPLHLAVSWFVCILKIIWQFSPLYRIAWRHTQRSASGSRWNWFSDCSGQCSSSGTWSTWETQKCHSQDLFQVWQNHKWLLSRGRWKDKRVSLLSRFWSSICVLVMVILCGNLLYTHALPR